jgi:hypothetical protein
LIHSHLLVLHQNHGRVVRQEIVDFLIIMCRFCPDGGVRWHGCVQLVSLA